MSKRAVIYTRVSTEQQDENFSIPSQIRECESYVAKQGMQVVACFQEDYSGLKYPRPELEVALTLLEESHADALVVYDSDRLNRHTVHGIFIRYRLVEAGATLHYVRGGTQDLSGDNALLHLIRDHMNQGEAEKIRERMMRGRSEKARSGQWIGHGRVPYGYERITVQRDGKDFDTLQILEQEADIVRRVYHWYADGESIVDIAQRLNNMGVPPPSHAKKMGGTNWQHSTVYRFLTREHYTGTYYVNWQTRGRPYLRDKSEAIPVSIPPVIEQELYDHVARKLKDGRRRSKRNTKHERLMARRLRCGICGLSVGVQVRTSKNGYVNQYYHCQSVTSYTHKNCGLGHFRQKDVDPLVWGWVQQLVESPESIEVALREAQQQFVMQNRDLVSRRDAVKKAIADQEQALAELLDWLLRERNQRTRSMFEQKKMEIEQSLQQLEAERASLEEGLGAMSLTETEIETSAIQRSAYIAQLSQALDATTFEQRLRIIDMLGLKGTLTREDGNKVLYLHWLYEVERLPVDESTALGGGNNNGTGRVCQQTCDNEELCTE